MDSLIFIKGLVIGVSIAAPVGPIGILCITRTLAKGFPSGLISGLGAATADALYGSVAGLGITWAATFLIDQRVWLRLLGGLFLIYLGIKTFISADTTERVRAGDTRLLKDYATTFWLTLTNPMTIISFGAVFAALGPGEGRTDPLPALLLIAGIFCGSVLWWVILSSGVSLVRGVPTSRHLRLINRVAGVVIAGFGLAALVSLVIPFRN